jgi:phosphoribosylaminoimidazolecarboxamide formyltransferase/IMP cyclohydrolase
MKKIAVFASGEGSNFQSLLDSCKSQLINGEIVLLVSNKDKAGALKRARDCGVESLVLKPADFKTMEDYDSQLVRECQKRGVDLVCLAGFMTRIGNPLLKAFPWKIMNIHPSLLPVFGGQGLYGMRVHEAVLKSGGRVSGCTVHLIDANYDQGKIVLQETVPVLNSDDSKTLAKRVLAVEHRLYPQAVRLFCEDRVEISEEGTRIRPLAQGAKRGKRALISVSDKTGIVDFSRGLIQLGFEIISSAGTAKLLLKNGIFVRAVEEVTGFPEILSGRVKTLHPLIHGGILMRRKNPDDLRDAAERSIEPIDLVCVNLYPFSQTAQKAASPFDSDVIEQIDIGGVALIRAAAKNFEDVAVIVQPEDYKTVLEELRAGKGVLGLPFRKGLALAAFEHTAAYDAAIANAFKNKEGKTSPQSSVIIETLDGPDIFPQDFSLQLSKIQDLRYGENPHQKAALYVRLGEAPRFEQLFGKALSYNNLLDAQAAWECAMDFAGPACAIFKHATPSGVSSRENLLEAFEMAWAADPLSAFGGVLAFNRPIEASIAEKLSNRFVEVVVAPDFEPGALALFKKKPNLRVIRRDLKPLERIQFRQAGSEFLLSEPDRAVFGPDWKIVSQRKPTSDEEFALRFAWVVSKHVKSNAIALTGPGFSVGVGAGQMSRVDSVHLAGVKYKMWLRNNAAPNPLVLASDAFFPFADGIEAAAGLGISAIIQPGGSVRDAEVITMSDQKNLAMVFTGIRHFRH